MPDAFENLLHIVSVHSSWVRASEYSNSILYLYTVVCVFAFPLIAGKKCEVD